MLSIRNSFPRFSIDMTKLCAVSYALCANPCTFGRTSRSLSTSSTQRILSPAGVLARVCATTLSVWVDRNISFPSDGGAIRGEGGPASSASETPRDDLATPSRRMRSILGEERSSSPLSLASRDSSPFQGEQMPTWRTITTEVSYSREMRHRRGNRYFILPPAVRRAAIAAS